MEILPFGTSKKKIRMANFRTPKSTFLKQLFWVDQKNYYKELDFGVLVFVLHKLLPVSKIGLTFCKKIGSIKSTSRALLACNEQKN